MKLIIAVLLLVVSGTGSVYAQSVYDLGIDGEVVKQCYQQIGRHVLIINVGSGHIEECLEVMDWFLQRDYVHTGEIINSKVDNAYGQWGFKSFTQFLVLTK